MNVVQMNLSDLKQPERNVRIHSDKQLKEFERSVTMFGQIRPLVIDEANVILAGNGLYQTLLRMGRNTAEVYRVDNLTANMKKKLMIADNKVFNLGIDDLETFNNFLSELQDDLDIPGFDEDILRSMVAEAEEVTERISDYGALGEEEIRAIQANGERKDGQILRTEAQLSTQPSASEEPRAPVTVTDIRENPAEVRQFAICPKCGEKVWL